MTKFMEHHLFKSSILDGLFKWANVLIFFPVRTIWAQEHKIVRIHTKGVCFKKFSRLVRNWDRHIHATLCGGQENHFRS